MLVDLSGFGAYLWRLRGFSGAIGLPRTPAQGSPGLALRAVCSAQDLRRASELGVGDPDLSSPSSSPWEGCPPPRRQR